MWLGESESAKPNQIEIDAGLIRCRRGADVPFIRWLDQQWLLRVDMTRSPTGFRTAGIGASRSSGITRASWSAMPSRRSAWAAVRGDSSAIEGGAHLFPRNRWQVEG
jgi:hypothetical protein